jgi:hypothetical protein
MRTGWLTVSVTLAVAHPAWSDPDSVEFFEKKVRPVLVEHCYSCHSTAVKQRGGLLLDTRDGLRRGGDSGPALAPGKPAASLFLKVLRHTDDAPKMPPKGKLPETVIADLEAWVKMGAPDPREKAPAQTATASWDEMLRTRRQWWSLQPVRPPQVPAVKDAALSKHPVDRFLLARLEQAGLQPAAAADPRTLIRRLSLVLTGLPPTPAEVERFCQSANRNPQSAIEQEVDRLLASPPFGERWARHWLDVVRFSETHGNEWNYEVHHAWRYRDYLIRAFNEDVPYDQFVREHIAGDLLPPRWNQQEQINEALIGTAFYRFGEVNHDDCIALRQIGFDLLDNQIDTLTKAFQATTVACARCHDHKVDAGLLRPAGGAAQLAGGQPYGGRAGGEHCSTEEDAGPESGDSPGAGECLVGRCEASSGLFAGRARRNQYGKSRDCSWRPRPWPRDETGGDPEARGRPAR